VLVNPQHDNRRLGEDVFVRCGHVLAGGICFLLDATYYSNSNPVKRSARRRVVPSFDETSIQSQLQSPELAKTPWHLVHDADRLGSWCRIEIVDLVFLAGAEIHRGLLLLEIIFVPGYLVSHPMGLVDRGSLVRLFLPCQASSA